MITIISPAKTLDFTEDKRINHHSKPMFLKEASIIAKEMKRYSPEEMEKLMRISPKLSELNYSRYKEWNKKETNNIKPAILAFRGDVYQALNIDTLSNENLDFANDHLKILSGLYGVLRPYDSIMPYRLEMGTSLRFNEYNNLYEFWKERLTEKIQEELSYHKNKALINLASKEYSKAINFKELHVNVKVIDIDFKEFRNGKYKTVGILAKRARGYMTRYILENFIDDPEDLKNFQSEGYGFNEPMSSDNKWIFTK